MLWFTSVPADPGHAWPVTDVRRRRAARSVRRTGVATLSGVDDRHARHRRTDADRRRRPVDGYRTTGTIRFQRLVSEAVTSLPRGLLAYLADVQVAVEDIPPDPVGSDEQLVLSRYHPGRTAGPGAAAPVDRLTVYRRPLEARALDRLDLVHLVQDTIVQELAQRFALDDDRLDELGWR